VSVGISIRIRARQRENRGFIPGGGTIPLFTATYRPGLGLLSSGSRTLFSQDVKLYTYINVVQKLIMLGNIPPDKQMDRHDLSPYKAEFKNTWSCACISQ
jgi:hypothetical protein